MVTQAERRATTRTAVLDAAAACLVENGVGGFTTADVVRRAGLSNGALFRYFPTKSDLLAATVEHVFDRLRDDYQEAFRSLPDRQRTIATMLELLWGVMSDPALAAIFDVYTAARTDAWMQAAIDPVARSHVARWQDMARELVTELPDVDPTLIDQAVMLAILAMQGLVVNLMAMPDPEAGRALVDQLVQLAAILLPAEPAPSPAPRGAHR